MPQTLHLSLLLSLLRLVALRQQRTDCRARSLSIYHLTDQFLMRGIWNEMLKSCHLFTLTVSSFWLSEEITSVLQKFVALIFELWVMAQCNIYLPKWLRRCTNLDLAVNFHVFSKSSMRSLVLSQGQLATKLGKANRFHDYPWWYIPQQQRYEHYG